MEEVISKHFVHGPDMHEPTLIFEITGLKSKYVFVNVLRKDTDSNHSLAPDFLAKVLSTH